MLRNFSMQQRFDTKLIMSRTLQHWFKEYCTGLNQIPECNAVKIGPAESNHCIQTASLCQRRWLKYLLSGLNEPPREPTTIPALFSCQCQKLSSSTVMQNPPHSLACPSTALGDNIYQYIVSWRALCSRGPELKFMLRPRILAANTCSLAAV
jgi:hypothetical protein